MRKYTQTIVKGICFVLLAVALALPGTGCAVLEEAREFDETFGEFSYNGKYLTEYAVRSVTLAEAKDLIVLDKTGIFNSLEEIPQAVFEVQSLSCRTGVTDTAAGLLRTVTEGSGQIGYAGSGEMSLTIRALLTKYGSMVATTEYHVDGEKEEQVREELYQGTDFRYLLETNEYIPFGQMIAKYIYVDDTLLDEMEAANEAFVADQKNVTAPFNKPYSYCAGEDGTLVLMIHSFTELPSSVDGGIGSTFRQDCEIVYDSEGKVALWQASLGIYTSTPTGTIRQGYIFKTEFDWNEKTDA